MKTLFKNLEEFQKYNKTLSSIHFEKTIAPYEDDAVNQYILNYIDNDTYKSLSDYYHSEDFDTDNKYAKLLPYVQRPLSRFMLFLASPHLDINIGTTGYTTASTGQMVPASEARVKKFDKSTEQLGYSALESLLKYLELNKAEFESWVNSDKYTKSINNIVNTVDEFEDVHKIDNSRLKFLQYRPDITQAEILYIIPVITQVRYDQIITELRDGELTTNNKVLLPRLRAAVVNYAIALSINPIPGSIGDSAQEQKSWTHIRKAEAMMGVVKTILRDEIEDDDSDEETTNINEDLTGLYIL